MKNVVKQTGGNGVAYEVVGYDESATAMTDTVVLGCTEAAADFAARLNVGQRQTVVVSADAAEYAVADSVQDADGTHQTARLVLTVSKARIVR